MRKRASSFIVLLAAVAACGGSGASVTAYVGMRLWDGSGAPPIVDAVVLVEDGRILAAGSSDLVEIPRGATEVRLDGRWIIPGLIDAHTHPTREMLTAYLTHGVTTIRDMGSSAETFALRDGVEFGEIEGPRIFAAGAGLDGAAGSLDGAVRIGDGSAGRREVGQRVLGDATHIALYPGIAPGIFSAILDEASVLSTPVAARLGATDALTAANAGVTSIELLGGIAETATRNGNSIRATHAGNYAAGQREAHRAWTRLDSTALDRTARALVPTNVIVVPALIASGASAPRATRNRQAQFVRLFRHHRGRIALGTESGHAGIAPGASVHEELALLVAAGLTPEEAILAATRDAARLLGDETIGVLREGGSADFIVLRSDPFADISNTKDLMIVVARGVHFEPVSLEESQ